MPKKLLVIKPIYDGDGGLYYLSYWSNTYIDLAKTKKYEVMELKEKRANRKTLEGVINKTKPHLICFNGHGNYESVTGQDHEVLVRTNDNEAILANSIVHILACSCGKKLGPAAITAGAKAIIAYKEEFWLFYGKQEGGTSRPLQDPIAALFLEPANEAVHSLLKGHSVEESFRNSQKIYKEKISEVLASDSSQSYLARFLYWDMVNQVSLGSQSATV